MPRYAPITFACHIASWGSTTHGHVAQREVEILSASHDNRHRRIYLVRRPDALKILPFTLLEARRAKV
jgi:hypothetical protein